MRSWIWKHRFFLIPLNMAHCRSTNSTYHDRAAQDEKYWVTNASRDDQAFNSWSALTIAVMVVLLAADSSYSRQRKSEKPFGREF